MTETKSASVDVKTTGLDHVALRSRDLARSRRFYVEVLGFPVLVEREHVFIMEVGTSLIGVIGPDGATPIDDVFDPRRVGMDHVALQCESEAEVHRVAAALTAAGIGNTGVKLSPVRGNTYVGFKDPDGIAWQVCVR